MYNIFSPVLNFSYSILNSLGISNFSKNRYCIEFQQINCFGEDKISRLSWHEDDYGPVGYEVYTIIYYVRKDITVKGGNLKYKIGKNIFEHHVNNGDVLIFSGDLKHCPVSSYGFGCRDLIACFIERV
jgi:hypothetical protein